MCSAYSMYPAYSLEQVRQLGFEQWIFVKATTLLFLSRNASLKHWPLSGGRMSYFLCILRILRMLCFLSILRVPCILRMPCFLRIMRILCILRILRMPCFLRILRILSIPCVLREAPGHGTSQAQGVRTSVPRPSPTVAPPRGPAMQRGGHNSGGRGGSRGRTQHPRNAKPTGQVSLSPFLSPSPPPLPMLSSRPRQSARPPARWPAVFSPPTASYGGGVSSDIRRGIEYAEYAEHTEYAEYAATNPPVIFGQTATLPHSQKPTRRTYIEQPTYLACGKNESPPTLFCCGYPI